MCPSRPDTVRTSTPADSSRVAAEWRRSWKGTPLIPSCTSLVGLGIRLDQHLFGDQVDPATTACTVRDDAYRQADNTYTDAEDISNEG